jgi:SAM-dependent methyltransferase
MTTISPAIQEYIDNRFSVGLEPYIESLTENGLNSSAEKILDVGSGPGQWSFAASRVAPDAKVIGFDINREEVSFAKQYQEEQGYSNVRFEMGGYLDLPNHIEPESCDVIMCNGVLMYLDRDRAFEIFSSLLKPGGQVFFYHNHQPGYYLHKISQALIPPSPKKIYAYGFMPLLVNWPRSLFFGVTDRDRPLSIKGLQRIGKKHGLEFWEIPTKPMLSYKKSFVGIPYIFSLGGQKKEK